MMSIKAEMMKNRETKVIVDTTLMNNRVVRGGSGWFSRGVRLGSCSRSLKGSGVVVMVE